MAVTILERPEGHILSSTENTATVSESYGAGDAQFVSPTVHGLVDGDFIYAVSDIEDYAGFWYVDAISTGIFKIRPYPTGDYVQFIASGSITWYASILEHGWSCVHLPITYRLSTDLYPTNSSDTTRTISSVTDSNGYSVIHLSGSLGSAVNTYDFVKITVPSDTDYSKAYQILEFISPTVMIINLEYDSSINWTSASALKHYNNYNIIVRVYAGINASHQWALQKPYELAATKEFIPDENNEVFFSIDDILRSYIKTLNNTVLGTLPNNIDFWTNFYIEIAESYDDSDGYVFGRFTSNYTSDQGNFEGTAVNAKLEFKNIYSGYLSAYLNPISWLTLFDELKVFTDQYFDISFLNSITGASLGYRVKNYLNNTLQSTTDYDLDTQPNEGVIRFTPIYDPASDEIRVSVLFIDTTLQPENNTFTGTISPWTNDGTGISWVYNANKARVVLLSTEISKYLKSAPYTLYNGISYQISVDVDNTTLQSNPIRLYGVKDGIYTLLASSTLDSSPINIIFLFTTSDTYDSFAIEIENETPSTETADVDNVIVSVISGSSVISDELIINISSDCSKQEIDLQWLNNLAGFDPWRFTARKDHIIEIQEAMTTKKNILPTWPKSYGAGADTIKKQTVRVSNKAYTVRSQFLTESEADAIAYIKSSVLVQIVNSRTDRRTVLVDTDSFIKRKDGDKTFEIAFNISFTDDIPSQTT